MDVTAALVVHFKNFSVSPFLYALINSSAASHSSDSSQLGILRMSKGLQVGELVHFLLCPFGLVLDEDGRQDDQPVLGYCVGT